MSAPPARNKRTFGRPLNFKRGVIELSHGSGGRAMAQLIDELFAKSLANPWLEQGNDQACLDLPAGRVAMTTDSYVISPLFFPGGDIGSLAVHGTINDIAMSGARPLHLSAGFIIEAGYPLRGLKQIVESMAVAARAAEVTVVTGDTKVVERGKADGVFINTTGIGVIPEGLHLSGDLARPGDCILINGTIGDHGVAVMSKRTELDFEVSVVSDSAALHDLVRVMVSTAPQLRCLRDPTRGGVATTLNEIARQSGVGMMIEETAIPIRPEVAAVCELLGLDPLYVANEGKLIAVCPPQYAQSLLKAMTRHPLGQKSALIGQVVTDAHHFVRMQTAIGGSRVVDWLSSEQLPRIC
jgi:hydrogenase expression/formation protein HypE